jgi:acyl-CoA reductase-like NAD-dependent aldehyde dehydrogenase
MARMFLAAGQQDRTPVMEVRNPWSGEVVDVVPVAAAEDVAAAAAAAAAGFARGRRRPICERLEVLRKAAGLIDRSQERIAAMMTMEMGKPITEARQEAARLPALIELSVAEAARAAGETLPLQASARGSGKFGFTVREPIGVVAAISPFNYPALLVLHKIAPALAAGNAVVLKPSELAPLTALLLTELMWEAGLEPHELQTITGIGPTVGAALAAHPDVRAVTFTGSTQVGRQIAATAAMRRLLLELGGNAPVIVMPDADVALVATALAAGGYSNAGQACISAQRVLVHESTYGEVVEATSEAVAKLAVGAPENPATEVASLVSQSAAVRVEAILAEAVGNGGRLTVGGDRDGAVVRPAVLADAPLGSRILTDELFGPAVAVRSFETLDEALTAANDSSYGLAASIFTESLDTAMTFVREASAGNIMINSAPLWRDDFMPYGGLKDSGLGKEGPRYVIEELTDSKTVVFHRLSRWP